MSWRARLGIVYPADGAIDDEFWKLAPEGVSIHITRFEATDEQTIEVFEAQADSPLIENSAAHLSVIDLEAIGYACTAGSFIHGPGKDLEIIERMEAASGVPCTTAGTALVKAGAALGATRLAVAAPYPADVTARLMTFLEGHGFEVVSLVEMGLADHIYEQPIGSAFGLAKMADVPEAEAVFISCTNFRIVDMLDALEADLDKPVVCANQAIVWELLNLAGVSSRGKGLGRLYQS